MKKPSRELLTTAAEVLNRHIANDTDLGKHLIDNDQIVTAVNEILKEAAEGGTLVCATEIDGTLLGFVPRVDVALPERVNPSAVASERVKRVPSPPINTEDNA